MIDRQFARRLMNRPMLVGAALIVTGLGQFLVAYAFFPVGNGWATA